ncbi:EpsG family protein [Mixta calida]|uniref:EpsG family protein n=1 Tax=Mixta calida TaxID=665913 RepID=UPI0034D6ADE0
MIFFLLMLSSTVLLTLSRHRVTCFFWIFLALASAFRFEVGTDYPNYVKLYYDIKSGYQSYLHLEPFHQILNKLAIYLNFGPQFIFFIYSIFTTFLFGFFYYKISKLYNGLNARMLFALCTILYVGNYYFLTLNSIRSCLAAAIYVMSLYCFLRKKRASMLILLIIGSTIHFSLIPIALLTILLLRFVFPVRKTTFYIFAAILIANPLSVLKYIFVTYKLMYYNYFLSNAFAVPATFIGQVSAYGGVFLSLLFYSLFTRYIRIEDKKLKAIFQFSILMFIAFRIFSSEIFVFARMSRYFSPVLYFFTALAITHYLQLKVQPVFRAASLLCVVLALVVSNIIMFMPRGLGDASYGNYKINYCINTMSVCDIPVSTMD